MLNISGKWCSAAGKFIKHHSETVDITARIQFRILLGDDFRSGIERSDHHIIRIGSHTVTGTCQTEIADFYLMVFVGDHDISRFDISVDHFVFTPGVVHGFCDLKSYFKQEIRGNYFR